MAPVAERKVQLDVDHLAPGLLGVDRQHRRHDVFRCIRIGVRLHHVVGQRGRGLVRIVLLRLQLRDLPRVQTGPQRCLHRGLQSVGSRQLVA